ncbi:leucine-rich repeat-containing protein 34 [Neosynchiropus ocellatus]
MATTPSKRSHSATLKAPRALARDRLKARAQKMDELLSEELERAKAAGRDGQKVDPPSPRSSPVLGLLWSWVLSGPGSSPVLGPLRSWVRSGPGSTLVLVLGPGSSPVLGPLPSWVLSGPGSSPVLGPLRSWVLSGPGSSLVLGPLRSWVYSGPGPGSWVLSGPGSTLVLVLGPLPSWVLGPGSSPVLGPLRSWVLSPLRSWSWVLSGPGSTLVLVLVLGPLRSSSPVPGLTSLPPGEWCSSHCALVSCSSFTLKLRGSTVRLDDRGALVLSSYLRNNGSVTGLDVSYNNITDEGARRLAELLKDGNSTLKYLNLTFNCVEAAGAEALAEHLQRNACLQVLQLSGNKVGNPGGMHLSRMLQANRTLRELQLTACDLTVESINALAIVLKTNRSLQCLDVSRPLLFSQQEEWLCHFSDMLAVNRSLLELHLGTAGVTDCGLEILTVGLKVNRSLRYLDLRCNRVTQDGTLHLAELMEKNCTLEVLDLSFNRIEDEGAVTLSRVLTRPGCSLTQLSVTSNSISSPGLSSLAQSLKVNSTVTHLYISGNKLEEAISQAYMDLVSSGRLPPRHTDVSVFEADGRFFLAESANRLRRRYSRYHDPQPGEGAAPL